MARFVRVPPVGPVLYTFTGEYTCNSNNVGDHGDEEAETRGGEEAGGGREWEKQTWIDNGPE